MLVYRCSHLLTPAGIGAGAVVVHDGLIVASGPLREVQGDHPDAEIRDLGDAILMPGLVNAHTHTELSYMGHDRPPGGDYVVWLAGLLERRADEDMETAQRAAERACDDLIARGTVAVGDICNDTWIVDVWRDRPQRGVLFHELLRLDEGGAVERFDSAQAHIAVRAPAAGWRWSAVPHAPHTTSLALMRALAEHARREHVPLSIHLAESAGEAELLASGRGPLRDFFEQRGFIATAFEAPRCTPFERVEAAGIVGPGALLVHCVGLGADEILRLGTSGATVVTCPRSNTYLGVGVAPVPALLDAGARLALGTDSLASAPDLDLFAEMSALRDTHPGLEPATIVRAATLGGATALGLDDSFGTIEPGKSARLVVVPFEGDGAPLDYLCSCPGTVFPLADAPFETLG
jgi:cytosine/adenosine deaminase-related metal-dependent hydrolase